MIIDLADQGRLNRVSVKQAKESFIAFFILLCCNFEEESGRERILEHTVFFVFIDRSDNNVFVLRVIRIKIFLLMKILIYIYNV